MASPERTSILQEISREIHKAFDKVFEECMKVESTYLAFTKDLSRSFKDLQNLVSGLPNLPSIPKPFNAIASENSSYTSVAYFPTAPLLCRIGQEANSQVAAGLHPGCRYDQPKTHRARERICAQLWYPSRLVYYCTSFLTTRVFSIVHSNCENFESWRDYNLATNC